MEEISNRSRLTSIIPLFIVRDVAPAIAFYRERLGFELEFLGPEDDPCFAIVERDGVRIMMKAILPEVPPIPNPSRHPWARWDAYVHAPDPDRLAEEFTSRGVVLHEPLANTPDQLRGFEVRDVDGYVLFFGRTL